MCVAVEGAHVLADAADWVEGLQQGGACTRACTEWGALSQRCGIYVTLKAELAVWRGW